MSIFDDAEGLLAGALGDTFAHRIRVEPRKASRVVKGGTDPDRPPFTIRAILEVEAEPESAVGEGTRNGVRVDAIVETIRLTIELSQFSEPALHPREGDEIVALDMPGEPRFRVIRPVPIGVTAIEYHLQRVAS